MSRESAKPQDLPANVGATFDRFKDAMRHIVSIPKAEIDRRAKAWAKRRRSRKRKT